MGFISFKDLINNVWIIQAFQIPVVLFIIVFSYVATRKRTVNVYLADGNETYQYPEVNHLRWIALGFGANLIYLGVHLNAVVNIIMLQAIDIDYQAAALDISTAILFFMASVSWYYKVKRPGKRNEKTLAVGALLLLSIVIFYLRFSVSYYFLCIYDFCCYAITGYLLWETIEIPQPILKTTRARRCLMAGFGIWALVQLAAPYLQHWKDLPGFAASTVSKLAILFGFYSFYITMVQDFMLKSNREQATHNSHLRSLQLLIDEVSKTSQPGEIESLITRHLTATLFNFDYFIFHQVDYLKRKIIYRYVVSKHAELDYTNRFKTGDSFELDERNIVTTAIKRKRTFTVDGVVIDDKAVDMNDAQHQFHFHFSTLYHHEELSRLFIPVIKLTNVNARGNTAKDFEGERVIGVFEAGYWKPQAQVASPPKAPRSILMFYIDNFAQAFAGIIEAEIRKQVRHILTEADRQSSDDEQQYLQLLFKNACEFIRADEGYIVLQSFNRQDLTAADKIVSFKTPHAAHLHFNIKANAALLENSLHLARPCFSNSGSVQSHSEIAIPLLHDSSVIGYVRIFSAQPDYFNEYNIYALQKFFGEAGPVFIAKKFHHILSELVFNESVISELEDNSQDIISVIQKYFGTDHVSIWLLDYTPGKAGFKCQATSSKIRTQWKGYGGRQMHLQGNIPVMEPVPASTLRTTEWDLVKAQGIRTLIHIPLKIDEQQYGFINIYAEREITRLLLEDIQFLKLIASKCVFALVTTEMINSFSKVSQSFVAKNQHEVLQEITTIARQILHSEPVILFLFDDAKISYGKTITSGFLYEKEKIYEGRASNFIELSVNQGEDRFYRSESELPKEYVRKNGFWEREKIMSLAAIPLKHKQQFIGVMYFNYRQQREFPYTIKKLIRAFSALAATAIVNADNVEVIKTQRKQLEENAQALQEKADKAMNDYTDTLETMEKMLPVANAWTLAEIVRAINHDIRNHLDKVSGNLENIKQGEIKSTKEREKLLANIAIIKKDIINTTKLIQLFEPDSFKISVENIYNITRDVQVLFTEEDDIVISVKRKKNMPDIRCVKAELSMVIYNLTINAVNAIAEKWSKLGTKKENQQGRIDLAVDYDEAEKHYILTVEDDGIGIDNEVLPQIYEPKFTTKPKGLGIGLYFVKETIENAYMGNIKCSSKVNIGTTFELKFKQHIK